MKTEQRNMRILYDQKVERLKGHQIVQESRHRKLRSVEPNLRVAGKVKKSNGMHFHAFLLAHLFPGSQCCHVFLVVHVHRFGIFSKPLQGIELQLNPRRTAFGHMLVLGCSLNGGFRMRAVVTASLDPLRSISTSSQV